MNAADCIARIRLCLKIICWTLIFALALLNLVPFSDSDEYIYTLKWINLICGIILIILIIALAKKRWRVICLLLSCALFLIPCLAPFYQYISWQSQYALSACWAAALFLAALALFSLGSSASRFASWFWCICGSVALALAAGEIFLLSTSQPADGIANLSRQSKYLQTGDKGLPENLSWRAFQCGKISSPPGEATHIFHRMTKFDTDLFDVNYSTNERGWRSLPKAESNAPNDLILFGCSMTFGHGLADEQTWAWQLAKRLGTDWQLENYAANAYSANNMLCLLEHKLIQPPEGKNRFALFLAIDDHLRRNDFFQSVPHYQKDEKGEPVAGGKHRFGWIHNLPGTFNGSQLARETGSFLLRAIMKQPDRMLDLYLAIIKRSADILQNQYQTRLYILLWPDFEWAHEKFEHLGIPIIDARPMLPDWDQGQGHGSIYCIDPLFETHPNANAARLIANGLANYFENIAKDQAARE